MPSLVNPQPSLIGIQEINAFTSTAALWTLQKAEEPKPKDYRHYLSFYNSVIKLCFATTGKDH